MPRCQKPITFVTFVSIYIFIANQTTFPINEIWITILYHPRMIFVYFNTKQINFSQVKLTLKVNLLILAPIHIFIFTFLTTIQVINYITIIVCTYKIKKFLKSITSSLTEKTREVQNQLSTTLLFQVIKEKWFGYDFFYRLCRQ